MRLLVFILCAIITALIIFVVTDAYTKIVIKKEEKIKQKAHAKGEDVSEFKVTKLKTPEQRIKENMPSKPGATIGDSAVEIIRREKVLSFFKQFICYAFLIVAAVLIIIPFYWMFVVSLKTSGEIELVNPTLFPGSKVVVAGKESSFVIVNTGAGSLLKIICGVEILNVFFNEMFCVE